MITALDRFARLLRATRLIRPALIGAGGAAAIAAARNQPDRAPAIVFAVAAVVAIAVLLRERGVAVAALGVGVAAAYATPSGLGPFLVATGAVLGGLPATVDWRIAAWPEIVDGVIALPGLAGLAAVVAAEPSERGLVVVGAAAAAAVLSWLRGPRHLQVVIRGDAVASYLAVLGAMVLLGAPDRLGWLGELPSAVVDSARSVVSALAVFAVACLIQVIRDEREQAAAESAGRYAVRRPSR